MFAVDCSGCGLGTFQALDPKKHGVLAFCETCRAATDLEDAGNTNPHDLPDAAEEFRAAAEAAFAEETSDAARGVNAAAEQEHRVTPVVSEIAPDAASGSEEGGSPSGVHPEIAAVLSGERRWCVIHGDCFDLLRRELFLVDHIVTDPPFDERTHRNAATKSEITREHRGISFAALEDPASLAGLLLRCATRWVVAFCALEQFGEYQRGAGDSWVRAGVWDKIAPAPQVSGDRPAQAVEGIAVMHAAGRKRWNSGGKAGIWRCLPPKGDERPDHETPKPEGLMRDLLSDFTERNDVVLDPFAGSGTTGVAALQTGRRVILIEKESKHVETIRTRMLAAEQTAGEHAMPTKQTGLFGKVA